MKPLHLKGYMQLVLSGLIFGFNGVFQRWIDMPAPVLLAFRFLFGAFALYIYFLLTKEKISLSGFKDKNVLAVAIFNTLTAVLFFYALSMTTIANAEILLYTAPVFLVVLSPAIFHEKLEKMTIISLLIAFLGVILIFSNTKIALSNYTLKGIMLGLSAGFVFSLTFIFGKLARTEFSGMKLNFYQVLISALILLPTIFFVSYHMTVDKFVLLIIMGVIMTTISMSLFLGGLKSVKAQHAGIISYFEPLSAVIYAALLFGEIPTFSTLIGGALIIYAGYSVIKKEE
ncbi:MAG: DMT family transporter [Patescibacteria group bacterium]|nr:DMT family transporter [Patescibacteria group bacterium]